MNNAYITTVAGDVYEFVIPESYIKSMKQFYSSVAAVGAKYLSGMEFIPATDKDGKAVIIFCKHIVSTYTV